MKLFCTFCFYFFLLSSDIFSQLSTPLPDSGATWTTSIWSWAGPSETHLTNVIHSEVGADTIISGNSYKSISTFESAGYYRVEGLKVFYFGTRYGVAIPDTTEFLLYDFGLQIGDSFAIFQDYTIVVSSIDSIQLNGDYLKRINFADAYNQDNPNGLSPVGPPFTEYCWVEGIGSALGFDPYFPYFESLIQFNCFNTNGEDFMLNLASGGNCENVGIDDVSKKNEMQLYPNPSIGSINLTFKNEINQIFVYDMSGRIVATEIVSGSSLNLDLSYLEDGMYHICANGNYSKNKLPFVIIH